MPTYTYNICGVYNESGEECYHKVSIQIPSRKFNIYDYLIDPENKCNKWLEKHYNGERIETSNFDLDCEVKRETPDNNNVIIF